MLQTSRKSSQNPAGWAWCTERLMTFVLAYSKFVSGLRKAAPLEAGILVQHGNVGVPNINSVIAHGTRMPQTVKGGGVLRGVQEVRTRSDQPRRNCREREGRSWRVACTIFWGSMSSCTNCSRCCTSCKCKDKISKADHAAPPATAYSSLRWHVVRQMLCLLPLPKAYQDCNPSLAGHETEPHI